MCIRDSYIGNAIGKAGGRFALAILQGEGGNTVFEGHLPVFAGNGLVGERHREAKLFASNRRVAVHRLCYNKIAIGVSRIRERGNLRCVLIDCVGVTDRGRFVSVRSVSRFGYFVSGTVRQPLDSLAFAALQGDRRNAVRERNAAVFSADGLVGKRDSEAELLGAVGIVALKRLRYRQAPVCVTCIRERGGYPVSYTHLRPELEKQRHKERYS